MSEKQPPDPIMDSDQSTEGGDMGVSSERVGHTGPGQVGTTGVRDTSGRGADEDDEDTPPEQSTGGPEQNPEGIPPKASEKYDD